MNTAVSPVSGAPAKQRIETNVAIIEGRIEEVRRVDTHTYTTVVCPAVDEYSSPQFVDIRSLRSIGRKGETIEARVRVGGFRGKPFQFKDKETGEILARRPVVMTLEALE